MRVSQTVRRMLAWYEGENPGVKANIARILCTGRLAGTGKVEISFVNLSEIPTRKDIAYIGPVPGPLQLYTNLEAALTAKGSGSPEAAAFVRLISGAQAKDAWEKAGFETAAGY